MKKYSGVFRYFGGSEICVFAKTPEEARKIAIRHFIGKIEKELIVVEMKAKTERCDICQFTFAPGKIAKEGNEQLCSDCWFQKYGYEALMPDDIPY